MGFLFKTNINNNNSNSNNSSSSSSNGSNNNIKVILSMAKLITIKWPKVKNKHKQQKQFMLS